MAIDDIRARLAANYEADVAEAYSLEAEYQSMHNGKMRDEMGELWYGSDFFRQHETATLVDMGERMSAVLAYATTQKADVALLLAEVDRLTRERDEHLKMWQDDLDEAHADYFQARNELTELFGLPQSTPFALVNEYARQRIDEIATLTRERDVAHKLLMSVAVELSDGDHGNGVRVAASIGLLWTFVQQHEKEFGLLALYATKRKDGSRGA